MSNKFLGLDSINVLKKYIDEQIFVNESNARIITIHAYKYVEDGVTPETPSNGSFDPEGAGITYPIGWSSMKTILNNIGDNAAIENALSRGSIWMTIGVAEGNNVADNWSTPIKISGQNGVSVKFSYAHDVNASEDTRTQYPSGVDANNRIEYVWAKYGDDVWVGPTIWAMYSADASDVLYRYYTSSDATIPARPTSDVDANWTNSISSSITPEKPFMWMTWKRVPAGQSSNNIQWNEPILFGHYGADGKDGLNGNVPDYSITLYAMSDSLEIIPELQCTIGDEISQVIETNGDIWFDIPESDNELETSIWWHTVININGIDNTVKNFSNVKRYSAIDGEVSTSVFTKYLFYWSSNQTIADDLAFENWVEVPDYKANEQDGSLWMIMNTCKINTKTGEVETLGDWSTPVKLTGPRGPIAYDYRSESLFGAGTADKAPTTWKRISEIKTSAAYPYIWEKRYLSLYKMKYSDIMNIDGTYDIVEDKFLKQIGDPDVFRLSGLNGAVGADGKNGVNGNRLNTIDYAVVDNNVSISNFDEINYFISNSTSDTHYTLNGNKFGEFVSGYTGKFTNIGTGNMIITTIDAVIVGSNLRVNEITVKPQESIELISYLNNGTCEFILIGKDIREIENPIENPGVLDSTQLVEAIAAGGEVKVGKDIVLTTPLIINNDVTVDLNGHEINAKDVWIDESDNSTNAYAFWVKGGNLTIRGNGKVTAADADYSIAVWCQAGNVTIESGEFHNGGESCSLIYASGTGNIVIKGGKYIATPKGAQPGTGDEYTALNLKDRDNMTCSIKVEGGHYYGFDPAHNLAEDNADWWEANPNGFVADGYSSIKNGEWYSVVKNPEI